ncbi:hypothetical protein BJX64DRAFT_102479 [Aspergillus heterothallicus]
MSLWSTSFSTDYFLKHPGVYGYYSFPAVMHDSNSCAIILLFCPIPLPFIFASYILFFFIWAVQLRTYLEMLVNLLFISADLVFVDLRFLHSISAAPRLSHISVLGMGSVFEPDCSLNS